MQFLIIGRDGDDKDAMNRRLAAREQHIALGEELIRKGNMWYGAAIVDEQGNMKGSTLFMDFDTEEGLNDWLKVEPYVTGSVWRDVEVITCNTREPWQFNRSREFFEQRKKTK